MALCILQTAAAALHLILSSLSCRRPFCGPIAEALQTESLWETSGVITVDCKGCEESPSCQLLRCSFCMLQTAARRSQPGRSRLRRRSSSSWTPSLNTSRSGVHSRSLLHLLVCAHLCGPDICSVPCHISGACVHSSHVSDHTRSVIRLIIRCSRQLHLAWSNADLQCLPKKWQSHQRHTRKPLRDCSPLVNISNRILSPNLVAGVTPGGSTVQVEVRRSDVQSAWSGLRPLAMDPNAADTASASRDHIVTQDPDGLITVTGGIHDPCNPCTALCWLLFFAQLHGPALQAASGPGTGQWQSCEVSPQSSRRCLPQMRPSGRSAKHAFTTVLPCGLQVSECTWREVRD